LESEEKVEEEEEGTGYFCWALKDETLFDRKTVTTQLVKNRLH